MVHEVVRSRAEHAVDQDVVEVETFEKHPRKHDGASVLRHYTRHELAQDWLKSSVHHHVMHIVLVCLFYTDCVVDDSGVTIHDSTNLFASDASDDVVKHHNERRDDVKEDCEKQVHVNSCSITTQVTTTTSHNYKIVSSSARVTS